MADEQTSGSHELQFDRVVVESESTGALSSGVVCGRCRETIPIEYYSINGHVVCDRCREHIEDTVTDSEGIGTFGLAAIFGVGAGIAGAVIYFAVIYFLNLEIGIVAILIGYMVGYSVRKGASGRGGFRFQVLAVVLTYTSVALAYAPLLVIETAKAHREERPGATQTNQRPAPNVAPRTPPRDRLSPVLAIAQLVGFCAILPILVIWNSFPSGLLSALIVFFGLRQAWRMTAAADVTVYGPYQVGAPAPSGTA